MSVGEFSLYMGPMALELNVLRFENPNAPSLVLMHGLLGSSRNWITIGRALQKSYDVFALDLRNHGTSPHEESMRWSELVGDLDAFFEGEGLNEAVVMGHSLGGKVAMRFACKFPERVRQLVIVDIAAKAYSPHLDNEFRAMKSIAVSELCNRKEAETALEPFIADWAHRQFLLTNLVRDESTGGFRWQINVEALHASLPHIRQSSITLEHRYEGPTLLVRGELSSFIVDGDAQAMSTCFPKLREVVVPFAGHNVHIENRSGFLEALEGFLD